jgi:hypothetical protein
VRVGSHDRIAWGALAAASLGVLGIARTLTPSASGVGTHTQLGLPACGFLVLFGVPCPACGLTTSFAHLAHGAVGASLAAHPLGLPLFVGLAVLALHATIAGVRGRPIVLPANAGRLAWLYMAALLVVWVVRLAWPPLSPGA